MISRPKRKILRSGLIGVVSHYGVNPETGAKVLYKITAGGPGSSYSIPIREGAKRLIGLGQIGSEVFPMVSGIALATIGYVKSQRWLDKYAMAKNLKETKQMRSIEHDVAVELKKKISYLTDVQALKQAREGLQKYHDHPDYEKLRKKHLKTLEYYRNTRYSTLDKDPHTYEAAGVADDKKLKKMVYPENRDHIL